MSYRSAYNIDDLRTLARKRLPQIAWDYLEPGAEDNVSLRENRAAFERIKLLPRTLVDVSTRSQKVTLFGKEYAAPFGVAPTGAAGIYSFAADIALARAARDANVPFVLSTASFEPMEKVAREAAGATLWFQLYMSKNREAAARLVNRARDAGYEALIVTTDVPMIGNREPNLRNGWQIPFKLGVKNMIDGALHPHWLFNTFVRTLLDSGVPRFQNTDVNVGGRIITTDLGQFRQQRDSLDWSDFQWLREIWPHKFFQGRAACRGCTLGGAIRCRRCVRLEPWRTPARRRAGDDRRVAGNPCCGGAAQAGYARRRYPSRFRCGEGAGAGRGHGLRRTCTAVWRRCWR